MPPLSMSKKVCGICKALFKPVKKTKPGTNAEQGLKALCKYFNIQEVLIHITDSSASKTFCSSCLKEMEEITKTQAEIYSFEMRKLELIESLGEKIFRSSGGQGGKGNRKRKRSTSVQSTDDDQDQEVCSWDKFRKGIYDSYVQPSSTPTKALATDIPVPKSTSGSGNEVIAIESDTESEEGEDTATANAPDQLETDDYFEIVEDSGQSNDSGNETMKMPSTVTVPDVPEGSQCSQSSLDQSQSVQNSPSKQILKICIRNKSQPNQQDEEQGYESDDSISDHILDLTNLTLGQLAKARELENCYDVVDNCFVCPYCGVWVSLDKFDNSEGADLKIRLHVYDRHFEEYH